MNDFIVSLKRAPFVYVVIPCMVGIRVAHSGKDNMLFPVIIILVVGLIFLVWGRKLPFSFNYLWGVVLFVIFCCAGYIHYKAYNNNHYTSLETDRAFVIRAVCLDSPQQTRYGSKCEVRVTHLGMDDIQSIKPFKAILFFDAGDPVKSLITGSHIRAHARFKPFENRGNPHEFDYREFLSYSNIYYAGNIDPGDWILLSEQSMLIKRFAEKCRTGFQQNIDLSILSGREKAILTAICLGDKSNMEERTMTLFKRMGIAHLFAVSGLHVGFIFLLFQGIFRKWAARSKFIGIMSVLVQISVIWLFTLITGLPDSAVRASIMFSIIGIGNMANSRYFAVNNLAIAACIILLINPKQIFQIGFQLSFLAVLGILLLYDKINKLVYFQTYLIRKIWEMVSVSIAAQFFIFPLLLYHFHQFSFAFVFANIFAIPVAATLLYGGLILNIFTWVPWLKLIMGYMIKSVFSLFLYLLDGLGQITWFFTDHVYLSYSEFIFLMIISGSLVTMIYYFRAKWILFTLSLLLVFFSLVLYRNYNRNSQSFLVAYNIPRSSTLSFITGKNHYLLTDPVILSDPETEDYYMAGQYLATGTYGTVTPFNINSVKDVDKGALTIRNNHACCWVRFKDKTVMVVQQPVSTKEMYETDVLLIRNYDTPSIKHFLENIKPGIVVFDNTAPYYHIRQWKAECEAIDQPYHHIYKDGAFILSL